MTVGNSVSELLNTQDSTLPQVSEFCLFVSKETRFLLLDVSWLYDLYTTKQEEVTAIGILSSLMKFEDFLNNILSSEDTSFVYEIIQPSLDDNSMSEKMNMKICCLAEQLYLDLHEQICQSLIDSNLIPDSATGHDHLQLLGFFATSAIVSIGDRPPETYPTFEEAYGHFGIKKWRDSLSSVPILKTVVPCLQGQYSVPGIF